jgi:hypothetical protein
MACPMASLTKVVLIGVLCGARYCAGFDRIGERLGDSHGIAEKPGRRTGYVTPTTPRKPPNESANHRTAAMPSAWRQPNVLWAVHCMTRGF